MKQQALFFSKNKSKKKNKYKKVSWAAITVFSSFKG